MALEIARYLRGNATDAERRVWRALRGRGLAGVKFRRQAPIGRFVVDFLCPEYKLIVEIDGGHHAENKIADDNRTKWLEAEGYRVIRFWNNDVLENFEGVIGTILSNLDSGH